MMNLVFIYLFTYLLPSHQPMPPSSLFLFWFWGLFGFFLNRSPLCAGQPPTPCQLKAMSLVMIAPLKLSRIGKQRFVRLWLNVQT